MSWTDLAFPAFGAAGLADHDKIERRGYANAAAAAAVDDEDTVAADNNEFVQARNRRSKVQILKFKKIFIFQKVWRNARSF